MPQMPESSPPPSLAVPRASVRDVVHDQVAADFQAYPELRFGTLETAGLDPRDAALAHTIHDLVIRKWLTLRALTDHVMTGELARQQPEIGSCLLVGAAQLVFLDRVPPHAIVDEAVRRAHSTVGKKASGFINAVLRKLAAWRAEAQVIESWSRAVPSVALLDGRCLRLPAGIVHGRKQGEVDEVVFSIPAAVATRFRATLGDDKAIDIMRASLASPPTVVSIGDRPLDRLPPELAAHDEPGFAYIADPSLTPSALLEAQPELWIQDSSAGHAVDMISDLSPACILDLCAGRGTKTRQLRRAFPHTKIVATDTDPTRYASLQAAFSTDDATSVRPFEDLDGVQADLVLLDVPCTNTGVLARRPEAKYRQTRGQLDRLMKIQRAIIRRSLELCAPGGFILYSTCSIEPRENERMVAWATDDLGMTEVGSRRTWPHGGPGVPHSAFRDGSFAALLRVGVP